MKAELRRIHSPDVQDLRDWTPKSNDSILLQLMVGPEGEAGEDSFDLELCTVESLADRVREFGVLDGRHHLVFERYDFAEIERYLKRRVAECVGDSWEQVASRVAQIGRWEFEDLSS